MMLKLFTVLMLAVLLGNGSAAAQSAVSFPAGKTFRHFSEDSGAEGYIYFNNRTGKELKMQWQVLRAEVPPGQTFNVCDNGNCYFELPPAGEIKDMFPLQPDEAGFMKVQFVRRNCASKHTAFFRFRVFPESDPMKSDTLEFTFGCYPASAENRLPADDSFFNLFTESGMIRLVSPLPAEEVKVFNVAGQTVGHSAAENPEISVPAGGVYFVSIRFRSGQVFNRRVSVN